MYRTLLYKPLFLLLSIIYFSTSIEAQSDVNIYGYFSTRYEKVWDEPSLNNGQIIEETSPAEWSIPFVNIMMQSRLSDKFRVFVNINAADAEQLDIRNIWGEYSFSPALNIRAGKIYRKFGLYNEILDAVPTYYGIEPPELFDGDHLIVSRTTTLMILGTFNIESGNLNYSLSTDNGDGGPLADTFPLGFDLNYTFGYGAYKLGISGYLSGGDAAPDISLGSGSPKSGVLPWMAKDKYNVLGGYFEGNFGDLTLQAEYIQASHDAVRDPALVVEMINNANLFSSQLSRFVTDVNNINENNVISEVDYDVKTWYVRAGYSFETSIGEFGPYFQWDWFSNPETIKSKTWGGDNEAGASEDGKFSKSTIGLLLRPIPSVAIKFDQSFHFYKINGEDVNYPEIRLDLSYTFGI